MGPIETAAIITCVVIGGIVTFKKHLAGVCVDILYFFFQLFFRVTAAWAGLVPKSVELRPGNDNKVVRAHYLERGATTTGSESSSARQDILFVPGFTQEANAMVKLVSTMNLPPETRVCVMELPLHGKNVENFDGGKNCFPEPQDIVDYAFAFVEAVGLGKEENGTKIPLSIIGFSLGGGVCFEMLAQQPPETYRKVILLAPALKETFDDDFKKALANDPKKVHGWETLEQCEGFVTKTACGFYPDKVPRAVLVGMHRQRELAYGGKDKSFFTNYYRGFHGIEFGFNDDETKQKLARCKTPVLVACGDRDNCISSEKCKHLFKDIDDDCFSFHEISDTGHVGGPANMRVMTMIFEVFGPVAGDFLSR